MAVMEEFILGLSWLIDGGFLLLVSLHCLSSIHICIQISSSYKDLIFKVTDFIGHSTGLTLAKFGKQANMSLNSSYTWQNYFLSPKELLKTIVKVTCSLNKEVQIQNIVSCFVSPGHMMIYDSCLKFTEN